ncbi:MAG TPA: carboxypeptidase-like regulatory domain-containing protein, partial [Vicinamibacteria bacterium]|nr:carboxypeptidase-like regulatory domain-containing protein [Vicinamibacteria bacterium]
IPFGTVRLIAAGRAVGQITTSGSGDLGFFTFSYVPAGPLRLEALDPATGRTGLAVGALESEGQNVPLDIRAQALGTVQGRVTSNGVPEPAALVDVISGTYRVTTAADAQGVYKIVGVPEGRVTVQASLTGGYLKATRSETLLGEGTVLTMDLALRPTGTVEGVVSEADGETPALAVVSLWVGGAGGGNFSRPTNLSGEFEFERMASGKGRISADELASIDRADADIDVPEGGTLQVPLRLNGVGSLSGVARGSSGAGTAGVLWVQGSGRYPYTRVLNVGSSGVYGFPELMAGPFTLSLRFTSNGITLYGSASGTIVADQATQLDVQLEPSGTVTGVVMRPGGAAPAFGSDVTLTHAKGTAALQVQPDGRFTFKGVPLGPITVRIVDPITTGRATVRGRTVASNQEVVDVGTLVLDNAPPTVTPVDPLDGGTRAKLAGPLVADIADVGSGLDTSSFAVRYASSRVQTASAFTFSNGRLEGVLWPNELVIGQNTIKVFVNDLAGNVTERPLTFTVTGATARGTVRWPDGTAARGVQVAFDNATPVTTDAAGVYLKTGLRGGSLSAGLTDPGTGIVAYRYAPVYDGEDTTYNLTLPGYGWITGTVRRSNGSLAGGVPVTADGRTVTTAADGTFNLGAFALKGYFVRATDAASGEEGQTPVTLETFRQVAQATILLNGVGHVIVNVKDANGA